MNYKKRLIRFGVILFLYFTIITIMFIGAAQEDTTTRLLVGNEENPGVLMKVDANSTVLINSSTLPAGADWINAVLADGDNAIVTTNVNPSQLFQIYAPNMSILKNLTLDSGEGFSHHILKWNNSYYVTNQVNPGILTEINATTFTRNRSVSLTGFGAPQRFVISNASDPAEPIAYIVGNGGVHGMVRVYINNMTVISGFLDFPNTIIIALDNEDPNVAWGVNTVGSPTQLRRFYLSNFTIGGISAGMSCNQPRMTQAYGEYVYVTCKDDNPSKVLVFTKAGNPVLTQTITYPSGETSYDGMYIYNDIIYGASATTPAKIIRHYINGTYIGLTTYAGRAMSFWMTTYDENPSELANITSWGNTVNSSNLSITVPVGTNITFNATANQSVDWVWNVATKLNGTNSTTSFAYYNATSIGQYSISATCSNINGTCMNNITWSVTVQASTSSTYQVTGQDLIKGVVGLVNISNNVGTNNITHIFFNNHLNANFSNIQVTVNDTIIPSCIVNNKVLYLNSTLNGTPIISYGNVADGRNCTAVFKKFENASDGDITNNPTWYGDTASYSVSNGYITTSTDNKRIYLPVNSSGSLTFEFDAWGGTDVGLYWMTAFMSQDGTDAKAYGYYYSGTTSSIIRNQSTTLLGSTANANEWRNVTINRNNTAEMELYVNGVFKGSSAPDWTYNDVGYFALYHQSSLEGRVTNIRVYPYPNMAWTQAWSVESNVTINYVPPTPININNVTGNFYINYSVENGAGNITNGYNISWNNNVSWSNGTVNNINHTLYPHASRFTCFYAFNSSNGGVINQTPICQNATIPNNIPILSVIENKNINEGQWLNFSLIATDLDNDPLTNQTNFTNGTMSGANFNWSVPYNASGVYVVNFNTTDNNSASDSEIITITVHDIPLNLTTFYPASDPQIDQYSSQLFNGTSNMSINASWYINGSLVQENISETIANYTNQSGIAGYWNVTLIITNGVDVISHTWNLTVIIPLPNITSWGNTNTSNQSITLTIPKKTNVTFNITINQSVTATWDGNASPTKINGTNEGISYAFKNFTTKGTYTVIATCSNTNGSCTNNVTWTITVLPSTNLKFDGWVNNTLGAPVPYARVYLGVLSILADQDGYFSFNSVDEDNYTTIITAVGYRNKTESESITENSTVNFTLNENRNVNIPQTPGFTLSITVISIITIITITYKQRRKKWK